MRRLSSPWLLMALAMLFWSGNWLLGRALRDDVTPVALNFWRWVGALAILLPFTARRLRPAWPLLRQHWRILGVLGLLSVALFQQLVYLALEYTTAINAAIFNSTGPIVIVCIGWVLFRDTISARQGLGIALSLLGVLGIVTHGDWGVLLRLRFNPGDLWALASVPVWGLYTVLLKRRPAGLDPLVFIVVIAAVGVTAMLPIYAWDLQSGGRMVFTPATLATIAYMALFASVLAYVFWNHAVAQVGANKAGLFLHLHPAFTTVLAMVFLGEALHGYHIVGIAFIVAGIYLTTAAPGPVRAAARAAAPGPAAAATRKATPGGAASPAARPAAAAAPRAAAPAAPPAAGATASPAAGAAAARSLPLRVLTSPQLWLVLTTMAWAGNWIVGRSLRHEATPLALNFWRWSFVLAWLLPFTWRQLWEARAAIRRDKWVLLALGALGIALFNYLVYLALEHTTAVNGALINSAMPVAIVALSWLLLHERINRVQALGIVISLLGVAALVTRGDPALLLRLRFNTGDLWSLACVPVWALYSVLLRRSPPELGPMALLTVLVLIGVAILLPFALWAHALAPQMQLSLETLGGLLYLALFASLLGMAGYTFGVARLGANVAGLFIHLVPAFTTALAWLLLGESLRPYHGLGVALIFVGIYLTTVAGRTARHALPVTPAAPARPARPARPVPREAT
jgi:drug/metabolite transporter (DMT)-like permease